MHMNELKELCIKWDLSKEKLIGRDRFKGNELYKFFLESNGLLEVDKEMGRYTKELFYRFDDIEYVKRSLYLTD